MPRPVTHLANLDLNLLVTLRELLRDHARHKVEAASRRVRRDDPHWTRGIILTRRREGEPGERRADRT